MGLHNKLTGTLHAAGTEPSALPLAGTGELIEDKTAGTLSQDGDASGALVVFTAVAGVLVLEVTVLAGALNTGGAGGLWWRKMMNIMKNV